MSSNYFSFQFQMTSFEKERETSTKTTIAEEQAPGESFQGRK